MIQQGLAIAPKDLELLGLKGSVLLELRDYTATLAAYQAYLKAGPTGGAAIAAAALWLTGAPESRVAVTPRLGTVAGLDLAVRF